MNIPAALWSEVSALFDDAMDRAAADRAAWLDRLQASRPDLAIHVRRLVEAHERPAAGDPLSGPPSELVAAALAGQDARLPPLAAGMMLGPYRLLEPLGEGGMASVWLAEQTVNVVRRVALKIPHVGLEDAAATTQRFAHERDLLAGLEHPQIARLYDAGVSADGRPYLAMEWIAGLPITRYADEHRLDTAQRIALFQQVLRAVRHAHARLVIHRDLKPSNILVTPDGQVRLLDFGIARLLDDAFASDADPAPGPGRALTPEAASPEQLAGEPLATTSDVYSLGVVLYELLSGRRPYRLHVDAGARTSATLHAELMAATVTPPSLLDIDAASASLRGSTPRRLRAELAGDLDAIVGKALAKQAAERYDSAEALAADLERHARMEPVLARGGGWLHVSGRALRRHRSLALAGAAVMLAIVAGTGGVAWQAHKAREEAARATVVKDFLVRVFEASDPRIAADKPRGQVTARELLDAGASRIETDFANQPDLQVELLGIVTELFRELGDKPKYLASQDRRVALAKAHPGQYRQVEIDALLDEVRDELDVPNRQKARDRLAEVDPLIARAGLDEAMPRAVWWSLKGYAEPPDQFDAQQADYEKAYALLDRVAPRDPLRCDVLQSLGAVNLLRGDYAGADRQWRQALVAWAQTDRKREGDAMAIWGSVGTADTLLGRYDDAAAALLQASAIAQRTYGDEEPSSWQPAAEYARLLHLNGQRDLALQRFEALRAVIHDNPTNSRGWYALTLYAERLAAEGRPELALPMLEGAIAFQHDHPQSAAMLRRNSIFLGDVQEQLGHTTDARQTLHGAYDAYVAQEAPDKQGRLIATERWARFLVDQGEAAQARPLFAAVLAQDHDRHLAHAALAEAGLARVALAQGDAKAADEASAAAVKQWSEVRGFRDVRMGVYITRVRAQALLAAGDSSGARTAATTALAASQRYDAPHAASITEADGLLQRLQQAR